jgi:hypothetical protein
MPGHECYHCKQWVEQGEAHDCWTTTEGALTRELSPDLQDAYERLRDTAAGFGEQRIYASHKSIMFSRKSCYFFVRPKRSHLELCVFLGRAVQAPHIRRVDQASRAKKVHFIHVRHRDEVEAPITDWLREAYDFAGPPVPGPSSRTSARKAKTTAANAKAPKRAQPKPKSKPRPKPKPKPARKKGGPAAKPKPARKGAAPVPVLTTKTIKRRS